MADIRCRNCGLTHSTKSCPSYGPMYPAPGKSTADYEEERERIRDLLASDIVTLVAEDDSIKRPPRKAVGVVI